jgi:nitrogen-specific signal transduction histidine kinase
LLQWQFRQNRQHETLLSQERIASAANMANQLAHAINNPLQSLTNLVYLASATDVQEGKALACKMSADLTRLTQLVKRLLSLPRLEIR